MTRKSERVGLAVWLAGWILVFFGTAWIGANPRSAGASLMIAVGACVLCLAYLFDL